MQREEAIKAAETDTLARISAKIFFEVLVTVTDTQSSGVKWIT